MNLPQVIVLSIVAMTWRRYGWQRAITVAAVALAGYAIGWLVLLSA